MASRDDVYRKFGITAEAAQLCETELGTLLLGARGAQNAWHVAPDPEEARKLADELDGYTLGALLKRLKVNVTFSEALQERLASALKARNRLIHGFFERHNFRMLTEHGRDFMMADLEKLHEELFEAWQVAGAMTHLVLAHMTEHRADVLGERKRKPSDC